MTKSFLRGHLIVFVEGQWVYEDTKTPTAGNPRECGHCGKADTAEGHDGCLGTLPGLMNACCGHGADNEAYVQFWNKGHIQGKEALIKIDEIQKHVLDTTNQPG